MAKRKWTWFGSYTKQEVAEYGGIRKVMKKIRMTPFSGSDRTDVKKTDSFKSEKWFSSLSGNFMGWRIRKKGE